MPRLLARLWGRDTNGAAVNGHHSTLPEPTRPDAAVLRRSLYVITSAESAPCTCPDSCERDHGND
jgi:hypothetical protein